MNLELMAMALTIAIYLENCDEAQGPLLHTQPIEEIKIIEGGHRKIGNIDNIVRHPELFDLTICTPWVGFWGQDEEDWTLITSDELRALHSQVMVRYQQRDLQEKVNSINSTVKWFEENPDEGPIPTVQIFGIEHEIREIVFEDGELAIVYRQHAGHPQYHRNTFESKPTTAEFVEQLHSELEATYGGF
jgi:hypothetical protein